MDERIRETGVKRPYKRSFERVAYTIPVEVTDRVGSFLIKAKIKDVSPVAARVEFVRPPRLQPGDNVLITIWKNIHAEHALSAFRAPATVLATRTPNTLVLVFDDPRTLINEGFGKFVYGPLLLASLSSQTLATDPATELSIETLRAAARRYVDLARDPGAMRHDRDKQWHASRYVRPSERRGR